MQNIDREIAKKKRKKIAILLPNPCNPDYRIIKYAELFNRDGHEVVVFCRSAPNLPAIENLNGVQYRRKNIVTTKTLTNLAKDFVNEPSKQSIHRPQTAGLENPAASLPPEKHNIVLRIAGKLKRHAKKWLKKPIVSLKKVTNSFNRRVAYKSQPTIFQAVFKQDVIGWGPDIVHCHDWQTLQLGVEIKNAIGSKLIFDSHELETHRNPPLTPARKRWMEKYEAKLLPQCDLVTTVCESIAAHLESSYKIPRPWVVVNSPIVSKALMPTPVPRWGRLPSNPSIRTEAGFSESTYLLTIVGNLTINRGVETLLDAMRGLPSDIAVAMVGKATPEFKTEIEKLIKEYNLENRVRLLDPVNPVFLVDFLSSANAGIIPIIPKTLSYQFALPNKLFECAFAGLPIIASDTVEIKMIIDRYSLGSTFPFGNHERLAKEILTYRNSWVATNLDRKDNTKFIAENCFEKSSSPLREWVAQS